VDDVRLTKHHGLGNDFLVLLDDVEPDPELARRLCDRRRGVGADGLIVGRSPAPATTSGAGAGAGAGPGAGADVAMVLYNADGSRAEMSGNGIRCLAQAVLRRAGSTGGTVVVATDAGRRQVEVVPTADPFTCEASVDMGAVVSGPPWPAALPDELIAQLGSVPQRLQTADVGNPHLVVLASSPPAVDLERFGPLLEAAVPGGVNVEFIALTPGGADELDLRVWERGAGRTEACGTGATAAAHVARCWGLVGDTVTVHQPGGDVVVHLGPSARLVGPATFVAEVVVPGGGGIRPDGGAHRSSAGSGPGSSGRPAMSPAEEVARG
jgi:diaminopimelate epimerase